MDVLYNDRSKTQHRDSIKTLCQSKDIPSLNDIYAQLGHPAASHVADLRALSQDWRQQYRTQSKNRVGKLVPVLGTDLTMWTSGFSQDNLHKMVIAFLEEDGNGPKLWPSNDSEPPSDAPEYPADKEK